MPDLEDSSKDTQQLAAITKAQIGEDRIRRNNSARNEEEQARRKAELQARQAASEMKRIIAEANAKEEEKEKTAIGSMRESGLLESLEFAPSEFTKQICPEAKGHFCMLWGDHGHGGYDTTTNSYIQGGQPMDDTFELIGIYLDFEEAQSQRNWDQMRKAVRELRQLRTEKGYSQAEERAARKSGDS